MEREEKLEFIRSHSPIVWFLDDEAFLPEDCMNAVKKAALLKRNRITQNGFDLIKKENTDKKFEESYAKELDISESYYLDLPDLRIKDCSIPKGSGIKRVGSNAVVELARRTYSNNPFSEYCTRRTTFQYYAEVFENVKVDVREARNIEGNRAYRKKTNGTYDVIQYHFYFIFNDWWDRHEADWERVEVIKNQDSSGPSFVRYFCHGATWLCDFPQNEVSLTDWLGQWQKGETEGWDNKREGEQLIYPHGNAYVFNGRGQHPFVFVSQGSHATYPTPGFTEWVVNIPAKKADMIIGEDERALGQTCLIPNIFAEPEKKQLLNRLKSLKIDMKEDKLLVWEELKLVTEEPWLRFRGYWGEIGTEKAGWDAWQLPEELRKCIHSEPGKYKYPLQRAFLDDFDNLRKRYRDGGQFLTYTRNFHLT